APKGGAIRFGVQGSFDSFNPFNGKGNAAGMANPVETLLTNSDDEPFTAYGLIAESLEWPEDRSWVVFHLREEARWHDGRPVTVEDVIFSLELLKTQGEPFFRHYYRDVGKGEKVGPRSVRFRFSGGENRELPLIVGQIPILPKHYWEGRDFQATTLDPPLGSGPYRVSSFETGRYLELERVEDYWGRDLPVRRGTGNFDRMRYEYFRDATPIREALKSGDIDYREENISKSWATEYDIEPVREGWLRKESIRHGRVAPMQAFVFNARRDIFKDRRVRRALGYAFDFEWSNRTLFYGIYGRTESYFDNSELASSGVPQGRELELLEPFRDSLPPEVFTEPFELPKTDGKGWPRQNYRAALSLLKEAGWELRDLKLVHAGTGKPMAFEILLRNPAFERVFLPFARNLKRLGVEARIRLVDPSQYAQRVRGRDFDMIVGGWGQSHSPGNEQRDYWGSAAAGQFASRNSVGIADPVVDALVESLIAAPDREELVYRTRALDRVLLHGYWVIPNWHTSADRVLYWDKFGRPPTVPMDGVSTNRWWFNPAKAAALKAARGG
ncbi:MAG: extracellular solute-binding protein, partial [Alphaproteobacteria bacterium]|nr:extracellular solute-binding protein [Alphaproteobacteria bacterium]